MITYELPDGNTIKIEPANQKYFEENNPEAKLVSEQETNSSENNQTQVNTEPDNLVIRDKVFNPQNTDISYYYHHGQQNWHRFDPKTGKDEKIEGTNFSDYDQKEMTQEFVQSGGNIKDLKGFQDFMNNKLNSALITRQDADHSAKIDYQIWDKEGEYGVGDFKDLLKLHDPDYGTRTEDDRDAKKSLNEKIKNRTNKNKPKPKVTDIEDVEEKANETEEFINSTPDKTLTYENAPEWFNNRSSASLWPDNPNYSKNVYEKIYNGTHGFNPKTGALVKLDEPVKVDPVIKEISTEEFHKKSKFSKLEERAKNKNLAITESDEEKSNDELHEILKNDVVPAVDPDITSRWEGGALGVYEGAVPMLQDKYTQFGFTFKQDGQFMKHGVIVTSEATGEEMRFPLNTPNSAAKMTEWMRGFDEEGVPRARSQSSKLIQTHSAGEDFAERQKVNVEADLQRKFQEVDQIKELWGLEGYSRTEVLKIMKEFSLMYDKSHGTATGKSFDPIFEKMGLSPLDIEGIVPRNVSTYEWIEKHRPARFDNPKKNPNDFRLTEKAYEFYQRRLALDSYTGHRSSTYQFLRSGEFDEQTGFWKDYKDWAGNKYNEGSPSGRTDAEKDGNVFNTKRIEDTGKVRKIVDGELVWVTEDGKPDMNFGQWGENRDLEYIIAAEESYKEEQALKLYKEYKRQTDEGFNTEGMYTAKGGYTEKGAAIKNDPKYKEIYDNLEIDDDDLEKYVSKAFHNMRYVDNYNMKVEEIAGSSSRFWFVKGALQKDIKEEALIASEQVTKITNKINILESDLEANINELQTSSEKLNKFNETFEEELPKLKEKYGILNDKERDKVQKNIEKEVLNMRPEISKKYKLLDQKQIDEKVDQIQKDLNSGKISQEEANKLVQNLQSKEQEKVDLINAEIEKVYANKIKAFNDSEQVKFDALNEDPYLSEYKEDLKIYNALKDKILPEDEDGKRIPSNYDKLFEQYTGELEELGGMSEDDLKAIIKAMGKNYDFGTRLSHELLFAGVDLAQGIWDAADMLLTASAKAHMHLYGPILKKIVPKDDPFYDFVDNYNKVEKPRIKTEEEINREKGFMEKWSNWVDEKQQNIRDTKYSRLIQFDEIEGFADAGEWALGTFTTQVPQLALMYFTGGASLVVMGTSSAGSKYREMNNALRLWERTNGAQGQNYDFSTMFLNACFTGTMEAMSEKITLAQIKRLKGAWGPKWKVGFENGIRKNIFDFNTLKRNGGIFMADGFEEGFSESVAQFSSNMADILSGNDVFIWDGIPESFASGWVVSNGIKMPGAAKKLVQPFRSKDTNQRVGEISDRIQKLTIEAGKTDDATRKGEIETEIAELVFESGQIIQNDANRIDLIQEKNPDDIKSLLDAERRNWELRKKADEIRYDNNLTDAQKDEQLKEIQNKVVENSILKEDILKKYKPEDVEKFTKNRMNTYESMINMSKEHGAPEVNMEVVDKEGFAERESKYDQNMSKKQVEEVSLKNQGLIQGLENIINDKNSTESEIAEAEAALKDARQQVQIADNILAADDYGVMQPKFDENGNITSMNIIINKDAALTDGKFNTAAHEFIHAIFANTLKSDPAMRKILGSQLETVLSGKDVVFSSEMKRREFLKRIAQYDVDQQGEEMMAIASEMMMDGDIKFNTSTLGKLKDTFRRFTQNVMGYDIAFNNENDIKNFLKDYHYSIKNNKPSSAIAKMLAKGANGKLFKDARTKTERKNESMHSRAVDKVVRNNPDLKNEFDDLVQKEGNKKHKDHEDFKASTDYIDGYNKIVNSKLLDGLIQQGMTDRGLPGSALQDFTRKVKEQVGDRYLTNYDLNKNDSLFGWLTGVSGGAGKSIIYRAKGDVMNEYKKQGQKDQTSLDKPIGEGGTVADVIRAEKDNLMEQLDEADMTPTKKRDLKNTVEDTKMVMETLNMPNNVKESVKQSIEESSVGLGGLSFKGVRDLLLSNVDAIQRKSKPQREKEEKFRKVKEPTGPLFNVLNSIAAEFGVDPLRIVGKQDLNAEQRKMAQKYIYDKAINEDGTLNQDFIDMLPEGQDRSGRSTGIANTKLGQFYTKGERAKMAKGATAAGLATQTKRTDITKKEFLNLFGINEDGSLQEGRKADGAIRELVVQTSVLTANQQLRINAINNNLEAESTIAQLRDGMSEKMYSKKIKLDPDTFKKSTKLLPKHQNKNVFTKIKATVGPEIDAVTGMIMKEGKFGTFDMIDLDAPHININTGKKTNITQGEHIKAGGTKLINQDPRMWQVLYNTMTGGVKRQSLMTKPEFIKMFGKDPYNPAKHGPPLYVPRIKYTKKALQDKSVIENFNENDYKGKIPGLINTFKTIENYLKTNPEYTDIIATLISDTVNNQSSAFTRISAPTYFALINPKTGKVDYKTKVTEEHAAPQKNLVANVLFNAALTGNVDAVAPIIESIYKQGSLADIDDTLVNINYSKTFPQDFYDNILPMLQKGTYPKELIDLVSFIRYVQPHNTKLKDKNGNPIIEYIDMNKYVVMAGIHKGKTVTEALGVGMKGIVPKEIVEIQNKLARQVLNGEISIDTAKEAFKNSVPKSLESYYKDLDGNRIEVENEINLQTQLKESSDKMSSKKTPEVQGLSVFDFDDTLGITKSGVRVKIPNPDKTPKPSRKVVFLAGGAGSGKGNVIKKLGLENSGFKIVNSDISLEWLKENSGLPADMRDLTKEQRSTLGKLGAESRKIARRKMMKYQGNADGVVVDGTGGSVKQMQKLVKEFQDKGYDVSMMFVDTSLDVALERNRARKERSLLDTIVKRNHEAVQGNKNSFKEMFGDTFMEVNTDNLTQKDPMPKELVAKVNAFVNGYEKRRLDAAEFAEQGDAILEQGGEFDFSEFDKVIEGRPGPLLDKALERAKKYGTKDIFVLTARTQKSAKAIHEFLKSQGLNIPIENITGLANSTGAAKAQWMLDKFAEGYNDMYFADDATQNVEAVKEVLDQLDIKSDVVQAKLNQTNRLVDKSDSMKSKVIEPDPNDPNRKDPINKEFNDMIERKKGVDSKTIISEAEAKKRGSQPNIVRFLKSLYIPPSAEDFKGLMYYFVGKGKQGDADLKWFKEKLFDPFAKGIRSWNAYKQNMVNEYNALKKKFKNVSNKLNKKIPGTVFTNDTAIRVYLFDKAGHDIPGISDSQKKQLIDHVNNNPEIKAFADGLSKISRSKDGYPAPTENWSVSSIPGDMNNLVNKIGRKQFLQEWTNIKNTIFSKDNLNKIEATYGKWFREALDNILYRMENGGNRVTSPDSTVNRFTEWINGSVGAIMFFNMRSALLQTISTVNFMNWSDNNMFKAAAAFANQPQFWKDFAMLFNSDQLKQRRKGLQTDVSASELTKAFAEGGATPRAVINYLLQKGFTPTQIADSFAIAFGGASMYRNRFKKYIKEGMNPKQAHEQAMLDFQEIAEETQQSSREDLVSQQQASVLGRIVLAFQNVTMQMGRLTKKALSDLVNGRGDFKTNVSKIIYYGVAQNLVFASLQTALAALMWGDDEEEIENRTKRTVNQALDSFLRGTGLYGALLSTLKNTIIQWQIQKDKPYGQQDTGKIALELINLSPPIGSKVRKIINAFKTEQYNKGVSEKLGWRIENPEIQKWASIIEAVTNAPTARLLNKANNLEEAITGDHLMWQRIAMIMGWNRWDVGVKDEELEKAKEEVKEERKEKKKIEKEKKKEEEKIKKEEEKKKEEQEKKEKGIKTVRCSGIRSNGRRCGNTTETDKKSWKCVHHREFKDGSDTDGDGKKEYRCTATKSNGQRCKNKTENTNKKCYAHQ